MTQETETLDRVALLKALDAVRNGDFSVRLPPTWNGLDGKIAEAFNDIVSTNQKLARGIEQVSAIVGTEGRLGQRIVFDKIDGAWGREVQAINALIDSLVQPVREAGRVIGAVARGVLTESMELDLEGRPLKGEFLKNANTINTMLAQLTSFSSEVTRVAREVGTEGKLGGQAEVSGASGVWKDLTDNVNLMASNLTGQVRNIAEVTTAVARGDLSRKITVDVRGEIMELKDTINTMVDQLNGFANEVTRVAREVGTEGKLGGQAQVPGVAGVWKDLTDNVNLMATNLTAQVRNIAEVTTAVARGNLSRKITVDVKGEILELKDTINLMVDQLNSFGNEVTRVAREVGTEGRLGGQAQVPGVAGVWKELTDGVNAMASNLTAQVRNIAEVTVAVARGDLSRTITVDVKGEIQELKDTINRMVDQLNSFAGEVTRVAREVGTEGKLGGQAQVPGVAGVWKDLTDNVNLMATNLTTQVRNIAAVTTAVANGDLSRKITVDVQGEIRELKETINTMVDQLNAFGGEVTRVAREVGIEGRLGGQAQVRGVSGVWKELTDSVNLMANNLTDQVRGIARVVADVAAGNLRQKMTVPAKGEMASLAETVNNMVGTLATFSDQVTHVAREVGVEGRLGGQAVVPGATGSWKDLVDNVNELAANLTTQVRAIGEVATAVAKGDLTRNIQVAARGEVAYLKDNINQMIHNLKETTEHNTDQDWLKTNLAHLTRMLQGQRDVIAVSRLLLSELAPLVRSQHAVLYLMQAQGDASASRLTMMASYGYQERKNLSREWAIGEGVVGQAAFERQRILLTNLPDDYIHIVSGLGEGVPRNIVVLPILFEGQVKAVIELASFERFLPIHLNFLDQLAEGLGIVFNSIESASGTEALLRQSQSLASELKSRQEELQVTNAELEQKARQLSEQNEEVESKNREIEVARRNLQEKAEQLALTSKYKSEFLANMSHELRTPLNSLLLLAEQLRQNRAHNLSDKQLEMVRIIHDSGSDLLHLINDILDLSKIESGNVTLDIEDLPSSAVISHVEGTFRHLAEAKGLTFKVEFASDFPPFIRTDEQRLKLVLKNLLANAIKFTAQGRVTLSAQIVHGGWNRERQVLNRAAAVLAFTVTDTGIGIPADKQKLIFEAFQQADSSTSRRYGGTGLGLAISREIAHLLGGELQVESEQGRGSRFTFYLPQQSPGFLEARTPAAPAPAPAPALAHETPVRAAPARPAESLPAPAGDDDRDSVTPQDTLMLVIEDDPVFAHALRDMARDAGFKAIVTASGEEGLRLAQTYHPDAITLDLILPDTDGWEVAERLKAGRLTRDIPVHVMSVRDRPTHGAEHGVDSYSAKPIDVDTLAQVFSRITQHLERPLRALLVIETDPERREAITAALRSDGLELEAVASAAEALAALHQRAYQGIVLDLDLPDMDGVALLREIRAVADFANIPAVVYSGRVPDAETEAALIALDAALVALAASSLDRLRRETKQFLQWVKDRLPSDAAGAPEPQEEADEQDLAGNTVMIVDDDIRNLFALTGLLESHGVTTVAVERGAEAIERLQQSPRIDLILMDIMMPEMDGYETIGKIRQMPGFEDIPIIALTAKAMKGDSEKCLAAGATDYASKPVDSEQLLTQLRVLLPRRE